MSLTLDGTNGITSSGGTNVLQADAVITSNLVDGAVTVPKIGATGSPDNTNFLRGDGEWATAGSPPGTLELLQEDIFTTSGTWTKATGYDADDTVMIFLVGGGGSGGAAFVTTNNGAASSGVPGGGVMYAMRYGDINGSVRFAVGAGGAAVTRSTAGAVDGNGGGITQILDSTGTVVLSNQGSAGVGGQASVSASEAAAYFASTTDFNYAYGFPNSDSAVPFSPQTRFLFTRQQGWWASSSDNVNFTATVAQLSPSIIQPGGAAARQGATNRTRYNTPPPAVITGGGAGSGTANADNATGIGCSGGGCVRQNVTAVSGAGAAGGLLVRYYRGRVSVFQAIGEGKV
jgi:hypothetical protein